MREKLAKLMQGRYGADQLSQFLTGVGMVCIVLNLFIRSSILSGVILVLLVLVYYRMFSKDYNRRYGENLKFLTWKNKLQYKFSQNKEYHIYRCPSCRQKIRVPRGKGKIIVTCPKCRTEFQKRS